MALAHLLSKLVFRGLTRGQEYLDKGLAAFAAQTQTDKPRLFNAAPPTSGTG